MQRKIVHIIAFIEEIGKKQIYFKTPNLFMPGMRAFDKKTLNLQTFFTSNYHK